jgi:hypothetical protein
MKSVNKRGTNSEDLAEQRLILLSFWGEHFLDMEGVRGSIPLPPTREKPNNQARF